MTNASAAVPTVPGLTGLSVLARGGYATVYRAVQESVGREVAVKVENRRLENERDQQRFLREARAAGRMSGHPNVIDLFDAGMTASGHPYLIMELCEASYAERMKNNPLSPVEARDVGVKIADALADAHALGVLHRDVKPANLLISRFGEPQLADFGLAVLAEARDHSVTLDVLTPAYASPEMLRYAPPSPAADVYALCATLYALMRGRPPRWHDEVNPSLISLVDMFGQPIPEVPGVPPELMTLLRAGMANDEAARPTAVELRDALLKLDFDIGGSAPVILTRRPVFGPPSWGPSESVAPGSTPMSGSYAKWRGRDDDAIDVTAPTGGTAGAPDAPDAPGAPDAPDAPGAAGAPDAPGAAGAPDAPGAAGAPDAPGAAGAAAADNEKTGAQSARPVIDPPTPAPAAVDGPTRRGRGARRPWLWLGFAAGCLALIILAGLLGWYAIAGSMKPASAENRPSPAASTPAAARRHWRAAAELYGDMGLPERHTVAERLADLDGQ